MHVVCFLERRRLCPECVKKKIKFVNVKRAGGADAAGIVIANASVMAAANRKNFTTPLSKGLAVLIL